MAIPRSPHFLAVLDVLARDLRYASRTLRRAPSFSLTVIATLAFGIGATTGVYSLINGLLLRELPVKDPHGLVTVSSQTALAQGRLAGSGWSYPMWERFRDRVQAFGGAFAWMPQRFNLGSGGEMRLTEGIVTTSDLFDTLGIATVVGRTFTASDDRRGGGPDGPVAVISHAFWSRHFGGAGDVIGSPLVIEGVPFSIVGVTPPGFTGVEVGRSFDVAITFGAEALLRSGAAIEQPNAFSLIPMLRLKPAQTIETATNVMRDLQPGIVGTGRMPPFVQRTISPRACTDGHFGRRPGNGGVAAAVRAPATHGVDNRLRPSRHRVHQYRQSPVGSCLISASGVGYSNGAWGIAQQASEPTADRKPDAEYRGGDRCSIGGGMDDEGAHCPVNRLMPGSRSTFRSIGASSPSEPPRP